MCGGLGELAAGAKVEDVVRDGAGDGAEGGLGIDCEGSVAVAGIDCVDIGVVVPVEERGVGRVVGA